MAKISPVSIKYIIYAKFEAEGTVEKPDVIGALFGQTEGLLGDDLEMRELQKEGKIGRIEVNLKPGDGKGKTLGEIEIPSAMDKAETTIIGAALETIERIGPSDAKIEITKIEDVRGSKRDYIVERAKKLLATMEGTSDTREMEDAVKLSSRVSRLQEYGTENLPAGDISGEEIIVVEGRADVINMLKAGVNNVIAMNGTILPETIKELSLEKEVTLFVDGDRGGKLIAKNAIKNARVDYIISAPEGKEVEELTKKEILTALRKKVSESDFLKEEGRGGRGKSIRGREYGAREKKRGTREQTKTDVRIQTREKAPSKEKTKKIEKLSEKEIDKIKEITDELVGTKGAILLNEKLEVEKKIPLSQLYGIRLSDVYAIVIDGTATSPIVRAAEKLNCQHLIAGNFAFTETSMDLVSI